MDTKKTTVIVLLTFGGLLNLVPLATASNEGNPGGPRQIPDLDLGCHFPNPADKVNSNPNCGEGEEGFGPPHPDCEASDNVETIICRPSSGHFD